LRCAKIVILNCSFHLGPLSRYLDRDRMQIELRQILGAVDLQTDYVRLSNDLQNENRSVTDEAAKYFYGRKPLGRFLAKNE